MIKQLVNIGIHSELDSYTRKSVRIINSIALISIFTGTLGELYTLCNEGFLLAGVLLYSSTMIVNFLIYFFNYNRKYVFSKVALLLLCNISLAIIILTIDRRIGAADLHYINFVIYIALVKDYKKVLAWSALTFVIYVGGAILNYYGAIHPLIIDSEKSHLLFRILFYSIASLIISLIVWSFRMENEKVENKLRIQLERNELLMEEIHHRVKNNLQIILSLLDLQMDKAIPNYSKEVLEDCKNRIYSMFLVHNNLFSQNESLSLNQYIEELCENIRNSFPAQKMKFNLLLKQKIACNINQTAIIGIIINELVTNSFKHAFESQENAIITITLTEKNNKIQISIADNGSGNLKFKEPFLDEKLGLKLITLLAKQLNASLEFFNAKGFNTVLIFDSIKP